VCVKAGVHPVPATLTINRTNVHLHGESPGAVLQGSAPLLEIGAAAGAIRIDNLDFVARVRSGPDLPIIAMDGASDVTIEDCRITTLAGRNAIGILIVRTDRARIVGNAISNVTFGIVVSGLSSLPTIEGNMIVFGVADGEVPLGTGIWVNSNPSACEIATNVVLGSHLGIVVNDAPFGAPRSSASSSAIVDNAILTGVVESLGSNRVQGIDAAADFTTVKGNRIALLAPAGSALRVTGSGSSVTENKVLAIVRGTPGIGLQIGYDGEGSPCDSVTASVNHIAGMLHGILAFNASSTAIAENAIAIAGRQSTFGVFCLNQRTARVTDNRISGATWAIGCMRGVDTRIVGNDLLRPAVGIAIAEETAPMISSNRVKEPINLGIVAMSTLGRTEFIENRVTNAGYGIIQSIGLGALLVIGEWHVEANEVMDTGVAISGSTASQRAIGIYGDLILEARVESNIVTYSNALSRDTAREDRALFARGLMEFSTNLGQQRLVFGFPIQIVDNKFIGTGRSALVELAQVPVGNSVVLRFERVFFTGNYCSHVSAAMSETAATVVLVGHAGVVSSNHVKATTPGFFSFNFNNMSGPFFGNVMSAGALNYAPFAPAPDGVNNMIL
jgi:nitrous oxidase accessory protein NosD